MQLGSISQMINSIHEAPSRNGFRVPVSLQIGTRVIRTTTLLDSGATTCFMDVLFGHIHSIAKVVKTKPIPVDLISFPRHPVMLGFSWLVMHNPIVDWRRQSRNFTTWMGTTNNNWKSFTSWVLHPFRWSPTIITLFKLLLRNLQPRFLQNIGSSLMSLRNGMWIDC